MNPLLEHAARVLEHQPTHSMEAEALYRRASRESGVTLPYPRFIEAVRETPARFAVLAPDPVVGSADAWDPKQRSLYEAALDAAGLTQPLIVLTGQVPDTPDVTDAAAAASSSPADVFTEVHRGLTHLLRSSDPGDSLYSAVSAALEELHAVRRVLGTR